MSYLDLPRFHLFGQFFANPSTINNETQNYNPTQAFNTDNANPPPPGYIGWNPDGQALFKMNVVVQSVFDASGTPVTSGDTLLGATLVSTASPNFGKIVDLDPDQQNISQVFGATVQLKLSDGKVGFTGTLAPCALTDLWGRVTGGAGGQGIASAGGMFQTVINVTWGDDLSGSPILQAFQALQAVEWLLGDAGNALSIKWNADFFNGVLGKPDFGYGRMAATIGPAYPGEPQHFVAARRLLLPPEPLAPAPLWFAPFKVVQTLEGQSFLVLDLGNSVATTSVTTFYDTAGNTPPQPPQLAVVAGWLGAQTQLAVLDYTEDSYKQCAGVFSIPLTAAQLAEVEGQALAVASPPPPSTGPTGATYQYYIQESPDGVLVGADLSFLRLDPGDAAPVNFYATKFGAPYAGCAFDLSFATPMGTAGNNNLPAAGLTWSPAPAFTGPDGTLTVTFTGGSTAGKPAWRTENDIDGQVYFVSGAWWPAQLTWQGCVPISAVVYDAYAPLTTPPTWWGDIQPIMAQYARLYPGMVQILDISDYATLQESFVPGSTNAQLVMQAMQLPITHPNHMPVTRDLSAAKVKAYADWVNAGCPEGTQPTTTTTTTTTSPSPSDEAADAALVETAPPAAQQTVVPAGGFGPGASSIKSSAPPAR